MDITPLVRQGQSIIQSYGQGRFRISGTVYDGPVLVLPDRVETWRDIISGTRITEQDWSDLTEFKDTCDVILFGSGETARYPDGTVRAAIKEAGLKIEFMNTGAACRTFNVLLAEGRRVMAALQVV